MSHPALSCRVVSCRGLAWPGLPWHLGAEDLTHCAALSAAELPGTELKRLSHADSQRATGPKSTYPGFVLESLGFWHEDASENMAPVRSSAKPGTMGHSSEWSMTDDINPKFTSTKTHKAQATNPSTSTNTSTSRSTGTGTSPVLALSPSSPFVHQRLLLVIPDPRSKIPDPSVLP